MDLKAVGQRIKAAREAKNLTQEELASLVNFSTTHGGIRCDTLAGPVKYILWFFQPHPNKHAHALTEIIDTFKTPKCHGLRLFPLIIPHYLCRQPKAAEWRFL